LPAFARLAAADALSRVARHTSSMHQAPPVLRPFVRPARELRWLARMWLALGLLVLGADIASGSLERLPRLELLGTPTAMVPGDLPAAAGLEAAGWILACSVAARQLRRWVVHWETRRGRVLFCPPLLSGRLAPVYYAAPRTP